MQPMTIAFFLLACAVVLIALEMIIPSGGVISALAALFLVASIVASFFAGTREGIFFSVGTCTATGVGVYLFIKLWPKTKVGRAIVMRPTSVDREQQAPESSGLGELVGKRGSARTKMLPSGTVLIDGEVYDAVSEGLPIESGDGIEVIEVRMNRIIVQKVDDQQQIDEPAEESSDDLLSKPIESLGIEPLDDPLA